MSKPKTNKKRKRRLRPAVKVIISAFCAVVLFFLAAKVADYKNIGGAVLSKKLNLKSETAPSYVDEQFIHLGLARNGVKLKEINYIVVHYTANPGSTAQNNRDYFNKIDTQVVSHFVIGLDGEIIECLPLNERSAASNQRNKDSISVEVCHPDESGKFNEATYNSLVKLTAWLCDNSSLDENDVIRHYDVTGKQCPKYFVDHGDKWEKFKSDVAKELKNY